MLTQGIKAPDFVLPDQDGNMRKLSDFTGKKVVLYFYSKDNTSGCTKQAVGFSELAQSFAEKNAVVIGISRDSVKSHKGFEQKHSLSLILLSDSELSAISAYDVWQEKKMCGKVGMGVLRSSFIIDENGTLEKVFYNVKAQSNPLDMLNEI